MKRNFLILLAVVACLGLAGCATGGKMISPMMAEQIYGPLPENYRQIVTDHARKNAIDPQSVLVEFVSAPEPREKGWVGQVEVNAKNRMGGYVGNVLYEYMIQYGQVVLFLMHSDNAFRSNFTFHNL